MTLNDLNPKNIDLVIDLMWFFWQFLAAKEWITTKWMEITTITCEQELL